MKEVYGGRDHRAVADHRKLGIRDQIYYRRKKESRSGDADAVSQSIRC
jgi:hypothetical protein